MLAAQDAKVRYACVFDDSWLLHLLFNSIVEIHLILHCKLWVMMLWRSIIYVSFSGRRNTQLLKAVESDLWDCWISDLYMHGRRHPLEATGVQLWTRWHCRRVCSEETVYRFQHNAIKWVSGALTMLIRQQKWRASVIAMTQGKEKGREEYYLYSAVYTVHSLEALRRGSHSFTGNYTMPTFPL